VLVNVNEWDFVPRKKFTMLHYSCKRRRQKKGQPTKKKPSCLLPSGCREARTEYQGKTRAKKRSKQAQWLPQVVLPQALTLPLPPRKPNVLHSSLTLMSTGFVPMVVVSTSADLLVYIYFPFLSFYCLFFLYIIL
jgi:hypothetical protein